jgi:hypothetical protein
VHVPDRTTARLREDTHESACFRSKRIAFRRFRLDDADEERLHIVGTTVLRIVAGG